MSTIREVALEAGVSYTTVSHVINKTRYVAPDTREKVLTAMRVLGYQPNALARSLRSGETHTLGLILPDSSNPFFAEMGRSIENAAFRQDYSVILCNTEGDITRERFYVDILTQKQVDGIIFMGTGDDTSSLLKLLEKNIPVVVVDRELPDIQLDIVLTTNWEGGYEATRHLIDYGHRRIGCITGPSFLTPSAQRMIGYRQALFDAGIPNEQTLVIQGDFHPETGRLAARQLLSLDKPPSAIFVCNDMMAIGVLSLISELGLRIPEDVSVVGFDDIELVAYTSPPLTTYAQPKTQMGQTAVTMLLERIRDHSIPDQRTVLPGKLVVRKSSGVKNEQ
jgi:LacI family transcriptional regulator